MSAIKVALQQSQKSGRSKTSKTMSAEVSPDSKCPICLDIFNNMSYLDLCLHKFCFRCIHEWSKNKAECPLCKQPFNSIYHRQVKSCGNIGTILKNDHFFCSIIILKVQCEISALTAEWTLAPTDSWKV
uniref:E3 ubiquitin-protein ligase Topors n=1 Tax=Amphiprion percula TaxID=161767 RepID=A0A3P8T8Z5_AMPPE